MSEIVERRSRRKKEHTVHVEFPGPDWEMDNRIRQAVGRSSDATGFDLVTRVRDMFFYTRELPRALEIIKKAKKIKGLSKISLYVGL